MRGKFNSIPLKNAKQPSLPFSTVELVDLMECIVVANPLSTRCNASCGKPGVTKGGQNLVVLDSWWSYIQAWYQLHGLNPKMYENSFNQQGPHEAKTLANLLDSLIIGNKLWGWESCHQIFLKPPHLTFNKHFSGCHVMHLLTSNGYQATCTCQHSCLPKRG